MNSVRVLRAGTLTTLQDRGRAGYRHLGVSAGGPMDSVAFRLANLLVGNASDQAALELTLVGPALLWLQTVTLAVAGADMHPEIHLPNGCVRDLSRGRPVVVPAGAVTEFGEAKRGCRAYLAVAGGFAGPVVLGSRAALLRSGFPGLCGRVEDAFQALLLFKCCSIEQQTSPGPVGRAGALGLVVLRQGKAV